MRLVTRKLPLIIVSTSFVLLLAACGGNGADHAAFAASDPVSINLSGPGTVMLGAQSQYSATITGGSDSTVSWSVNGVAGGNSTIGSISASGLYTAPQSAPQSATVTIAATSAASPAVSKSLPVALVAPPSQSSTTSSVTLTLAGPTSVTLGASASYVATITGSSNTAVTWMVNGVPGGNATDGLISSAGVYAAPSKAPAGNQVTISATSIADPSVSGSQGVTIISPPAAPGGNGPGSAVTLSLSGATTVKLGASAQYTATVTGSSDTAIAWSVNGVVGGDASVGKISSKGLYTAPTVAPQSSKVTILATSMADRSVSQSVVVTLAAQPKTPPTVTLTLSGPTSVTLSQSSQYAATVTGSTNTGVTWSVDGMAGGDSSVGTISSSGKYTAPASAPQSSRVTITATSKADAKVSQSMAVTLSAPKTNVALTLSGATTVTLGTSSKYTATVTGTSNTGVIWSVNGVTGGTAAAGQISTAGLYTAPTVAPQPSTVTITATSAASSTVAKSIVTTLTAPANGGSRIPSNAVASVDLNSLKNWQWTHDPGTPGSSSGSSSYPVAGMSSDNVAREFYMTYSGGGGEIYHVSFANDKNATHFVYDAYVYVVNPQQLKNLEMDMNDVTANGQTLILGTQCSGYSGTWEYTLLSGGSFHWHPSNISCNPANWSANTWHHIQIATHRDGSGNAYYDWVSFDGQYSDFQGASGTDAKNLGWAPGTLLINFQIDGPSKGSGSNTLYTDKLIVWRW